MTQQLRGMLLPAMVPLLLSLLLSALQGSHAASQQNSGAPHCPMEMQVVMCGLAPELVPLPYQHCCTHWQARKRGAQQHVYYASPFHSSRSSSSSSSGGSAQQRTIIGSTHSNVNSSSAGTYNSSNNSSTLTGNSSSSSSSNSSADMPRIDAADQDYLVQMLRPDLNPNGSLVADEPNYYMGHCTQKLRVPIPVISPNGTVTIAYQRAPRRLTKDVIFKTKAYVMSSLRTTNLKFTDYDPVKAMYKALRSFNESSGFVHPGGVIGPAELALMQHRLQDNATLQVRWMLNGSTRCVQKSRIFAGVAPSTVYTFASAAPDASSTLVGQQQQQQQQQNIPSVAAAVLGISVAA
jgi:hypothetical protein